MLGGPAVALCESVPDLDAPKTGGKVHRHVPVTLLKAVMLSDVVEVVWEDERVVLSIFILVTRQNLPSDGDITSKRAFLVDVVALDGLLGCLEAQADVFVVLQELLLTSFSKQGPLLILKDGRLLLARMLSLNVCHLPRSLKKGRPTFLLWENRKPDNTLSVGYSLTRSRKHPDKIHMILLALFALY